MSTNNNINQIGRSMVEMLGVLAIIGVLSTIGIFGYLAAMEKYKSNKFIEQINLLENNVRNFFILQKDYEAIEVSTVALKLGLFPSEMLKKNPNLAHHIYGGSVVVRSGSRGPYYFTLEINNIPKKACIAYLLSGIASRIEVMWGGSAGKFMPEVEKYTLQNAMDMCPQEFNHIHFGYKNYY